MAEGSEVMRVSIARGVTHPLAITLLIMSLDTFRDALITYGQPDIPRALHLAQQATTQTPGSLVYREAVTYLERVQRDGKSNVYVSPTAFGAFIRGGGNVPLYVNTSVALRRVYEHYESLSLLDIGVGDGLALLPALTPNIRHLNVLEPSLAMLNQTSATLNARNVDHRAINATVQQLMQTGIGNFDVIQSTYALQSLKPEERPNVLSRLRQHAGRLLIVEFDAPDFADMYDVERVHYFIEHYERGLAEYADDIALVAQGFLMPVFFGGFDPTEARVNWEMPIADWTHLLREAGFADVRTEPIYDYWWATAYLVHAK